MKPFTKKIVIGLGLVVLIGAAFGVGAKVGIGFAYKLYKPEFETQILVTTRSAQYTLEAIDLNKIEEARKRQRLILDPYILTLHSLIEDTKDQELRTKMTVLLERIAKHRSDFKDKYKESFTTDS
jgi:hypothetical protein